MAAAAESFLALTGKRTTGQSIRSQNVTAAAAIANIVKSSLGPVGLDKMLVDDARDVIVTNDGATIEKNELRKLASVRILMELAQLQDEEVGDGTTSVVIIAAELLKAADELMKKGFFLKTIINGYRLACKKAVKYLQENLSISSEKLGRQSLIGAAKTSMSSKIIGPDSDFFAAMCVDAAKAVKIVDSTGKVTPPIKAVNVLKAHGKSARESMVIKGYALNYNDVMLDEMEKSMHDALCVVRRVLESKKLVAGGGAVEAALNVWLEAYATTLSSKKQLAVAEFANALLVIPKTLAANAAMDSTELVAKLRAFHKKAQTNKQLQHLKWAGLDLEAGEIRDNKDAGVLDPLLSKVKSLKFATEAAITILRLRYSEEKPIRERVGVIMKKLLKNTPGCPCRRIVKVELLDGEVLLRQKLLGVTDPGMLIIGKVLKHRTRGNLKNAQERSIDVGKINKDDFFIARCSNPCEYCERVFIITRRTSLKKQDKLFSDTMFV